MALLTAPIFHIKGADGNGWGCCFIIWKKSLYKAARRMIQRETVYVLGVFGGEDGRRVGTIYIFCGHACSQYP